MASEILLATRSADKLREIREITSAVRVRFVTLAELKIEPTAAEDEIECFDTFVANAAAKARYFARLTGMRTLADDSGLAVDALAGAPGVRSRRFAIDKGAVDTRAGGRQLDEANNRMLLELLADLEARAAHYVCAVALADTVPGVITAIGTVSGSITRAPIGSGGFGYDPLFYIPAVGKTFAELTRAEKHARSHRAVAVRAIAPQL
ncbi:MAG: non-canonical purine NTP pyrophosphatase [Gemmatimonadota bacterium]